MKQRKMESVSLSIGQASTQREETCKSTNPKFPHPPGLFLGQHCSSGVSALTGSRFLVEVLSEVR